MAMPVKTFYVLGRQFDKHGNLKQWWNNRTIGEFRKAAQCIIDQYSNYTLDEINLPIDGRLTQGENIADNGGLKQAFRASSEFLSCPFIQSKSKRLGHFIVALCIMLCLGVFCVEKSCFSKCALPD